MAGKHVPLATVTHATGETACCLRGPRWGVIKKRNGATSPVDSWQAVLYCNIEEKAWAREAEEFPLLASVARERLLKTVQTGEHLVCSDL
jgi:hypothetical protein